LQAFNWECHSIRDQTRKPAWLQMLADKADAIADAGITAVWLPPPCQAISDEVRSACLAGGNLGSTSREKGKYLCRFRSNSCLLAV